MNNEEIKKDKTVTLDRLRYTKNTIPSYLAYIAIIFNVLFFISIYRTNQTFYYRYLIGISVLANLVFILTSFLAAEGIKNYKYKSGYLMIGLGVIEIIRIFIIPRIAHETNILSGEEIIGTVMNDKQFVYTIICLSIAAICLIIGGIYGIYNSKRLYKYIDSIKKD